MHARGNLSHLECPYCAAPISFGRIALGKKVRCPKCRKLINPHGKTEKEQTPSPTDVAVINIKRSEKSSPTTDLPTEDISLPIENRGQEPNYRELTNPYLSNAQVNKLLHYLKCGDAKRQITICVDRENASSLLFAEFLKEVFTMAGWRASNINRVPSPVRKADILALVAGTWPFPIEITMIYMALTSAKLDFSSHMDPNQIHEKAVLLVSQAPKPIKSEGF